MKEIIVEDNEIVQGNMRAQATGQVSIRRARAGFRTALEAAICVGPMKDMHRRIDKVLNHFVGPPEVVEVEYKDLKKLRLNKRGSP